MKGTSFQLKVWTYLKKIPRGSVKTYSEVAKGIGKPLAVRAVANAIGKNPYAQKIPCHRVIRSDGSLGGYSGKGGIKTTLEEIKLLNKKAIEITAKEIKNRHNHTTRKKEHSKQNKNHTKKIKETENS